MACLDRMVAELEKHFSVGEELLNGIHACSPKSDQFLSESYSSALALRYHTDLKSEEVMVAKNYFRRKRETGDVEDMLTVYSLLDADMFASVQVALTVHSGSFSVLCCFHTCFHTDSIVWL